MQEQHISSQKPEPPGCLTAQEDQKALKNRLTLSFALAEVHEALNRMNSNAPWVVEYGDDGVSGRSRMIWTWCCF